MQWRSLVVVSLYALSVIGCGAVDDTRAPPRVVAEGITFEGMFAAADIAVFRGIPYAAPPTGALRWQPPTSVTLPHRVHPAVEFAPACAQPLAEAGNLAWYGDIAEGFGQQRAAVPPMPETSEDCLYLNVWTSNLHREEKRPVMVWIYGGSNHYGWAYEPLYDGMRLAQKGVVVVSVGYRVGEFGWFAHPALTAESAQGSSGNYGLLDLIAALQWVQRNIAAFGGNPGRVTVFGESAGGANVGYLMASPLARGLFHRAISQSSGYEISDFRTLAFEEARGIELARALGIDDSSDAADALRAKSAEEIIAAAEEFRDTTEYGPNVDGWVLPESPARIFAAGQQALVPLIIGANADEWSIYTDPDLDGDHYLEELQARYGDLAPEALILYPDDDDRLAETYSRWRTDDYFLCPSRYIASSVSRTGEKAFFYLLTRVNPRAARIGAYHGAELPYIFDTADPWMAWTPSDDQLSETIADYWVQFATTGDPNRPGLPQWPTFDDDRQHYLELNIDIASRSHLRDAACDLYYRLIAEQLSLRN